MRRYTTVTKGGGKKVERSREMSQNEFKNVADTMVDMVRPGASVGRSTGRDGIDASVLAKKDDNLSVLSEADTVIPIANVGKMMKTQIADNAKISKEAKECVQECVSEFISFITSEASEKCHHEKRKTVNGEDILTALQVLGFDNYYEPLKLYLERYRKSAPARKFSKRGVSQQSVNNVNAMYHPHHQYLTYIMPTLQQHPMPMNQPFPYSNDSDHHHHHQSGIM